MGERRADLAIIGAGAAGLMAAIHAGRSARGHRVLLLESARRPGAKILVSGGGRCNVTHERVEPSDFCGASPHAIRKVLRRFDVPRTLEFFGEIGVRLRREETGKLFPVDDRARTVLDALLGAAARAGVETRHPCRVERLEVMAPSAGFLLSGEWGSVEAGQVVLATGGRSLPKSGSDGHGFALARSAGHTLTPHVFPALVPLLLPDGHPLRALSGVSAEVTLEVHGATGRRLAIVRGPMLCTHTGISGPAVLDISRHLIAARFEDPGARLVACWSPGRDPAALDQEMRDSGGRGPAAWLRGWLPDRLARLLCSEAGVDPAAPLPRMAREDRRRLARTVAAMDLPISGDRGFTHAEVTAGGVPLDEIHLDTMRSRIRPGLLLCGEILAVDGRVGGFNFQWAWATGFVAGSSAFGDGSAGSRDERLSR